MRATGIVGQARFATAVHVCFGMAACKLGKSGLKNGRYGCAAKTARIQIDKVVRKWYR
jgi:hypothetical protein